MAATSSKEKVGQSGSVGTVCRNRSTMSCALAIPRSVSVAAAFGTAEDESTGAIKVALHS